MRLKTLEIKGFKSFATPTVINFNEDVIGVVGPNGSGKSNVVDAIRWVLGEQKTNELRLDKMQSVIFNGSKKRRQAGRAEVSLTFENTKNILPTEYQTVTITRILYRSGESEYRLNNVTCRLKDITSLFVDTGIGSNSYAIIALNMVDDILNDKNDARRRMFEQAAGISKYKMRKKQTLGKLKSTSADLERVEDLLFEIENNLKTLEKQARRAKRYLELKEKYKTLSIQLAAVLVKDTFEKQQRFEKEITEKTDVFNQTETLLRTLDAQLEKHKRMHLDEEKALSSSQRELNDIINGIRELESNKKVILQKQAFTVQNRQKLDRQKKDAAAKIGSLEHAIDVNRERLNEEKRLEAELEGQLNELEAKLENIRTKHSSIKTELDAVMQGQNALEREVLELEKQKAINTHQIANINANKDRDKEKSAQMSEEIEELKQQLKIITTEEKEKLKLLNDKRTAEAKRDSEIQKAEKELEEINQKAKKINRDLDAKRNEFKLTESMVENLEGFPESIRFLSKDKKWKSKAPLLSDLIFVKEDYRVAIENFLEPWLNYYVVEDYEHALNAVQLLTSAQKGKANFFILNAIAKAKISKVLIPNTIDAMDVVETDKEYKTLFQYLLQNVFITENDQFPAKMHLKNATVITKDGRIVQRKYSLTGGSVGLFEGKKIGRKKNLEHLKEAIKKAEKEALKASMKIAELKLKIDTLKAARSTEEIKILEGEISSLGQKRVFFSTKLENYEAFAEEAAEKRRKAEIQVKELEKGIREITATRKEKSNRAEKAKETISKTDGSFRKIAEELSAVSAEFNQKNIAFIRQQNMVSTLQKELSFKEQQLEETQAILINNTRGIEEAATDLEVMVEELAAIEKGLAEGYAKKEAKEASLSKFENAYFGVRQEIHRIEEEIRINNRKNHELQIAINTLKDKNNELRLKLSAYSERLQVEFDVHIDEVTKVEIDDKINLTDLQAQVEKLRHRLENYGEINPMAVTAFDEMKERYDTIIAQRDDILAAKDSLLETIKEIEEKATEHFIGAFDRARLYFIDVFRELFTEDDNCDLILLTPEDPLESKIEIVAKPKGKKPQSISQLSGGEKTLTAIALLFALYLLKPAPFCIFDEVDAPLDDVNIMKFNKIIQKFSKDSQFIVITHNKLTMSSVHTIYGIHMAESGVSTVTPVDFRSLENITLA